MLVRSDRTPLWCRGTGRSFYFTQRSLQTPSKCVDARAESRGRPISPAMHCRNMGRSFPGVTVESAASTLRDEHRRFHHRSVAAVGDDDGGGVVGAEMDSDVVAVVVVLPHLEERGGGVELGVAAGAVEPLGGRPHDQRSALLLDLRGNGV